ncbi:MAG: hypothetical protein ABIJ23_03420 [Candidatus Magasanikbacteria bacterium]
MITDEFQQKHNDLDKNITLGVLLEYTDEFLIPKMDELITERLKTSNTEMEEKIRRYNAEMENKLKTFIDRRLSDYVTDIFKKLEKHDIKEKEFKAKIVEIMRRNNLASGEELSFLEGLIQGSY